MVESCINFRLTQDVIMREIGWQGRGLQNYLALFLYTVPRQSQRWPSGLIGENPDMHRAAYVYFPHSSEAHFATYINALCCGARCGKGFRNTRAAPRLNRYLLKRQ
jgi:hypothetical protein